MYIYVFMRRVGIIVHYIAVGIILLYSFFKKKKHLGGCSGNTATRRPERVSHIYIFMYPYSDEVVFFRLYFGVKKELAACVFVYISTDEFLALANDDEGWKPDGWSRGKRPTVAAPSRRRELLRRDGKKEVAGVEKKRNIYMYIHKPFICIPPFLSFFFR